MLTAIKGTFRSGRVELDEDPGIVGYVVDAHATAEAADRIEPFWSYRHD